MNENDESIDWYERDYLDEQESFNHYFEQELEREFVEEN